MTSPETNQSHENRKNPPSPDSALDQSIIDLTFELGQLRAETRHGWLRLLENEESVAEHTARAAQLGYLLATLEGFEQPELVATMVLFHDRHEVRTGDADLVNKQYLQVDEERAAAEQVESLGMMGDTLQQMWREVEERSTTAGNIAKDAEILEMCFVARELVVKGVHDAQKWIDNTRPRLETESAKRLLEQLNTADPGKWWKDLCGC
jgi:putative hydrolase of HD superfamily